MPLPQTNSSGLIVACDDQELHFARAFALLQEGIAARAFPGAVLAVTYQGRLIIHKAAGRFTYDADSATVRADTIYDLASVTKVIATTAMAMLLFERGRLDLEAPLVRVLPEFNQGHDSQRDRVTMRMLLAHSSGLPGYVRLFESARGHDAMLKAACAVPLESDPGTRADYSDTGFILLGEALERLAGERLDRYVAREILQPLGMAHTAFCPPQDWHASIPPAEHDHAFRHRVVQGEVQDENAAAMGGVAGHAGLFAPALEVVRFAECMLNGGAPILRPDTVQAFVRREISPVGTSRALGWDTPSAPSQSGKYFSADSFGHLGYVGTSLWIDPRLRLSVTLLSNRTWPDRQSQTIKQVRPAIHDTVIEALGNSTV